MNFLLSDDLSQFRETLHRFFTNTFPLSSVRKHLLESAPWAGVDEGAWQSIAELGVFAAGAPEQCGGLGLGLQASFLAVLESAKVLLPLPLFETVAFGVEAGSALPPSEARDSLLQLIVEGKKRVTGFTAGGLTKDGCPVASSLESAFLVVAADHTVVLHELPAGVERERVRTLDLVRPYFLVRSPYLGAGQSLGQLDPRHFSARLALLGVAELIGVGQTAVQMTADYVKTRKQFDRAIGTFQAVQHKLADCYLQLEQLEALALFAAWAAESDPAQFYSAVAACKGLASAEVPRIIETTVQVHGGIGFTYEYDLHLLLRRARVVSSLFGGEGQWFEELASLELTGPP